MKSSFRLKILVFLLTLTVFVLLYTTILNETIQKSHQNQTVSCSQQQQPLLNSASVRAARYIDRYPFLLDCQNSYKVWSLEQKKEEEPKFNYSIEAPSELHDIRITRAVIIYFPLNKLGEFKYEFKWLYRSWLNMIGYEPTKWRTDLIVFIEKNDTIRAKKDFFFTDMNCKFENVRTSPIDKPMCTLVEYFPISKRQIDPKYKIKDRDNIDYDVFFKGLDIFSQDTDHFNSYYMLLKDSLSEYHYTDSIMMAFDGYEYFKKAGYDFLVRSDMDVFLTPLFAKWLPRYCNDFYVGRGGYSNTFNSKRFKRIASNIGLSYAGQNNLGSTWYSTPSQFRLVSYLTLLGMAYLNNEEFAQPAREKKLGTLMWPEWHYGVLLLYGQHLLLNHLIGTNQINVVKLQDQLDYPSGNNHSIYKMIHIHVFHGDNLFSKLVFRMGKYDNMTSELDKPENKARENQVNWFSFRMAMEGKYLKFEDLAGLLSNLITKKT